MLFDFAVPAAFAPAYTFPAGEAGALYESTRWTPERLAALMEHLETRGKAALAGVGRDALFAAWGETVETFRDPGSDERQALDPLLAGTCRLSPVGLAAGLEAVLGGVRRGAAERLFAEAAARATPPPPGPAVVLLASNLPALAVQPLLPALALGRPVLLKSPSAEPLFAPAFVAALAQRAAGVAEAVAALTWRGGEASLEAPVLAAAGRVLAYGEQETLDDLERRAPGKVFGYGPKTSLAVVGAGQAPAALALGLASDIGLFDQRGCMSVAAVYTAGDPEALARALAIRLATLAARWPPGPSEAAAAAAVQQLRGEADMRGLYRPRLRPPGLPDDAPAAGTVVVEPRPEFAPSPGLRTVRVHPLPDLGRLPEILAPWRGKLQGAALAGDDALALRPALEELGVSRFAAPGELQSPDATWHNGGVHPLEALAGV